MWEYDGGNMKDKILLLIGITIYFASCFLLLSPFIIIFLLTHIREEYVDTVMIIIAIVFMVTSVSLSYKLLRGGDK